MQLVQAALEPVKSGRVTQFLSLPTFPAFGERIRELSVGLHEPLCSWKVQSKVATQQMLQQTGRDCRPQIFLGMASPYHDKSPYSLRFGFNKLSHRNYRLPARIGLVLGGRFARQQVIGTVYGIVNACNRLV